MAIDRAAALEKIMAEMRADPEARQKAERFRKLFPDSWLIKPRPDGLTLPTKVYLGSPNLDRFTADEDF